MGTRRCENCNYHEGQQPERELVDVAFRRFSMVYDGYALCEACIPEAIEQIGSDEWDLETIAGYPVNEWAGE